MPSYRDHLLFGSLLVLVFSYVAGSLLSYTPEAVVVSAVMVLLASVFPDIDHSGSVIHRMTRAFTILVAAAVPLLVFYPSPLRMAAGAAVTGTLTALAFAWLKPRHRTVTHTLEAAVVFSTVVGLLSFAAFDTVLPAIFSFLAYYSHIALDSVF